MFHFGLFVCFFVFCFFCFEAVELGRAGALVRREQEAKPSGLFCVAVERIARGFGELVLIACFCVVQISH